MSVVDTSIFPDQRARETPFNPTTEIPATDTQGAIEYVRSEAAAASVNAVFVASLAQSTADQSRGLAARSLTFIRKLTLRVTEAESQVAMADSRAQEARGLGARAFVAIRGLISRLNGTDSRLAMAESLANEARGQAQKAQVSVRKIDDVQIALKAQVFN